jgi:hypothetical protein
MFSLKLSGMKELFTRYIGQKIGLNFKEIGKFHVTILVAVYDEYFSVRPPEGGPITHYPFRHVLSCTESADGIPISAVGLVLKVPKVPLVVQTHVLQTKTGTIVGVSFAI